MARKKVLNDEDLKAKKAKFQNIAGTVEVTPVEKFLTDNFLPYSWSYVLDRALVDVSGLKPVQKRILYSMYKDGLTPNSNRSKVATLAGRVLAYHPHGDSSVSDALKNLARDHIFRVPLIDGKGDFGVPGTPGAAGRYLEARLNKAAWLNVEELAENAVTMGKNYDGKLDEPTRLPVRWPIAVINGGSGIAVGYASSMPSHNPTEIMQACKTLVRNPNATTASIAKIVQGPDFNMGGLITSNDGIKEYLETGKGSFKIRGQYDVIPGQRGSTRIEFYEIPFGTYPEKIIEEIQKKSATGGFKEIANYKDLSDLKHPIRLVIETKNGVNYKKVLKDLFAGTSLESNFSVNITTIVNNRPVVSSMKDLLLDFIEFRKMCIKNKMTHSLNKKNNRLHLIEGLLKTLLDIDAAIAIIRKSDNDTVANTKLQKTFKIDEEQANYVLELKLRRLTKMDSVALQTEKKELTAEISYIKKLLRDEGVLRDYLIKEFDETLKIIGDERKTVISNMTTEEAIETEKALAKDIKVEVKDSPCFVNLFVDNVIIKGDSAFKYNPTLKKFKNGPILGQLSMNTNDNIVLIGSDGIGRRIPLSYLNTDAVSTPRTLGLDLPKGVTIIGIAKDTLGKNDVGVALGTKKGLVKVSKVDFPNKDEFPVILIDDDDAVLSAVWLDKSLDGTHFSFVTKESNILVFDAASIRASGSKAGGVRGIKLKNDSDEAIYFGWVKSIKDKDTFIYSQGDQTLKATPITEIPTKNKGAQGVALHTFKKGETRLVQAFISNNPIMSMAKFHNASILPTLSKRAARGVDFTGDINFGHSQIV